MFRVFEKKMYCTESVSLKGWETAITVNYWKVAIDNYLLFEYEVTEGLSLATD